jgi:hypothetical protein
VTGVFARLAALLPLAACGGVSHHFAAGAIVPATVAVLPVDGRALPEVRATARGLATSWLMARGYDVLDTEWVDQALAERGWLDGSGALVAGAAKPAEVAAALGAEAVLVLRDVDEAEFNVFVLRRHRVCGRFELVASAGTGVWTATHGVGSFGGVLLGSGQVLSEALAVAAHGTPMATLGLVDQLVAETVATLPERARAAAAEGPSIGAAAAVVHGGGDGSRRLVVTARSVGGVLARFDVDGRVVGMPMVPVPGQPGAFRGAYDLGTEVPALGRPRVRVHVRDALGGLQSHEVRP